MKRVILAICLAILGPQIALSDQVSSTRFKGLNNNTNAVIIDPSESQDLLNVDVTVGGGSVKKRLGYGIYKALSTGQSVHGGYHFFDTGGNDVQVWGSSTSLYGIVADATPVQLVSSATLSSTWDCADTQGNAYCVNSSRNMFLQTNGTTATWYGSPLGTMVEVTPDRVVVAGVSGSLSTLYVSQSNTFTNFVTGVNDTDAFTEVIASPGSKLTHTRWGCGKLLWWKDQSFGYFDFENQFTASVQIVSDSIGTFDNTSAIDPGGQVWFRGQDGHTWKYDCSTLTKESIDISPNVQTAGNRTSNLWTQTTQSDFASGSVNLNGPTLAISTAAVVDAVVPGSSTLTDSSSADFSSGVYANTIDTTSISGATALKTYLSDNFTSGTNWTQTAGVWTFPGYANPTSNPSIMKLTTPPSPSGDFIFQFGTNCASSPAGLQFFDLAILNSSGAGYGIGISNTPSDITYRITYYTAWSDTTGPTRSTQSSAVSKVCDSETHLIRLNRNNTTGGLDMFYDGVAAASLTDSNVTSFSTVKLFEQGNGKPGIYNMRLSARTGNFTSRTFDTQFSTPIYGTFTTNVSSVGTHSYAYRCSASQSSGFTADTAITSGGAVTGCALKRYFIYSDTMTASDIVSLPTLYDASVVASSTGTFYSAVKNAPSLTGWSTFGATILNNGGSHAFYMRSSTNSFTVTSPTPTWTAQNVGASIGVSTGTYFQVRDDFSLTIGTQNPTLNDFVVNWFEGAALDQAYLLYFDNAIWESVTFGVGISTNNYIFKRDLINDGWTLYNFGAGGMLVQSNRLYFGDTSSGNVFNFGTSTSDNGTAINAYWRSKTFTGPDPFLQNQLTQVDVFAKKDQGSTLTATYTLDSSTATSYSVNLSTANAFVQSRKLLPSGKLGYGFDFKLGDTSTSSAWEVLGYRILFSPLPWRPTQ